MLFLGLLAIAILSDSVAVSQLTSFPLDDVSPSYQAKYESDIVVLADVGTPSILLAVLCFKPCLYTLGSASLISRNPPSNAHISTRSVTTLLVAVSAAKARAGVA